MTKTLHIIEKNDIHPKESAGRLLISNVPTVGETAKIEDVEKLLLEKANVFETVNYIYILSPKNKLRGVMSIKEIFRSPKKSLVKSVMIKKVITARVHTDQERAGLLALEHNIKAIPVVDKDNVFLGIIPNDTILAILHAEGVENVMQLSGVTDTARFDNIFNLSIFTSIRHRLPWLLIGLLGGLATASLVGSFEEVLAKNLMLAAFIPLVVYMADAVGMQMVAFIIRDLAVNPDLKLAAYLWRQTVIVFIISAFLSTVTYFISRFIYHDHETSFVLMVGLFCAIVSSLATGLLVPYFFGKFNLDPANASGPIATTIQDFLSIGIYFTIASLILL